MRTRNKKTAMQEQRKRNESKGESINGGVRRKGNRREERIINEIKTRTENKKTAMKEKRKKNETAGERSVGARGEKENISKNKKKHDK